MRKFLKIASITLASLLGLILVAVGVLVYWVSTPERLTPVVRDLADEFITCDYEIGRVDLTFFSTFPEFGLRADGILIENPVAGAQSDTVLAAKKVVARIDIMALLQQGELSIREVALADAQLNAFISEDGTANFDVLSLPQDTTPEDTTEAFAHCPQDILAQFARFHRYFAPRSCHIARYENAAREGGGVA